MWSLQLHFRRRQYHLPSGKENRNDFIHVWLYHRKLRATYKNRTALMPEYMYFLWKHLVRGWILNWFKIRTLCINIDLWQKWLWTLDCELRSISTSLRVFPHYWSYITDRLELFVLKKLHTRLLDRSQTRSPAFAFRAPTWSSCMMTSEFCDVDVWLRIEIHLNESESQREAFHNIGAITDQPFSFEKPFTFA